MLTSCIKIGLFTPLNQYTQRTVPGNVQVRGEADPDAIVTVNENPTWRYPSLGGSAAQTSPRSGATSAQPQLRRKAAETSVEVGGGSASYFYGGDYADNAALPVFKELEIAAVVPAATPDGWDEMSAVTGRVFVAQTPEQFTYDADGNMLTDGRFRYTWNGENRLVRAQELVAPTNRHPYTVSYAYDHRGRMVSKRITVNDGHDTLVKSIAYVWDGWNVIRETVTNPSTLQPFNSSTDYVWGLDLDGTLQGAGGVGGLLAVVRDDGVFLPTYDANGNVSEYISEDGEVVAHYDYSPFGETLIESGNLASTFTHRFSTKPWCSVTGLYEYQMRKYRPGIGRWMSRDPMRDYNEINEQGFVGNKAVERIDYIGLAHIINNASEPILAVGNVGISDSCRKYLMENIKGLKLDKHGINGVLFILIVGEKSKDNKNITDIDGYWTTFSPGTPGHVEKIRLSHTIGDDDLSGKTGDTISAKFLGGASISDWIANTLEGVYQKHIINGRKKCKCTDSDIANMNFAIFSSLEASLYFYEAK